MIKLVALGLVLFLTITLAMSMFQNRAVFPTHLVGRAGPLPAGTKRLRLDTPDGYRLQGVHVPPSRPGAGLLVLGFAGNAWNSADVATYLSQIYPHADVVAFHYRGYAPSTGSASAAALLADAPLVLDAAIRLVRPKRTVAVGFSIGSAIAASLAGRSELDGVILVTPFDSLKAVAQGHYPWLPVGVFFREEMNSVESLKNSDMPVALIAAERDTLIPPTRTDALRRKVRNLIFDRIIEGAGHNDIYESPEFRQAMREASTTLTR